MLLLEMNPANLDKLNYENESVFIPDYFAIFYYHRSSANYIWSKNLFCKQFNSLL